MKKLINKFTLILARIAVRLHKSLNKNTFNARIWSNDELRKTARFFHGDIINVSAGKDKDKQNGFYKDYFVNKSSYTVTNYAETGISDEIILDLENELPEKLYKKFDTVFSHTVLEHIYDINKAVENLCKLSKDCIITVVPFLQTYHHEEKIYYDFWRISPLALIKKFREHGFKTLYINWNNDPFGNLYIFHIASYKPENYAELSAMNEKNINQDAPGAGRNRLLTFLNNKSDRSKIKTLETFLKN